MKISRRDLDDSILQKIDQLDNVLKTYDENHPDGFISYGKNGFYFKKTNDTYLKKICDENELVSLENALTSKDKNIVNTYNNDLRIGNFLNNATKSFLHDVKFSYKKEYNDKVLIFKKFDNAFFLLTADGFIHRDYSGSLISVNILEKLETTFNLAKKIFITDIVDIEIIDFDNVIIATSNFGIYKFSITKKEIELLAVIPNLRKIKMTFTKNLFVVSDDFCAQYDISNGNRIEKYMNIFNKKQIPLDIDYVNGDIFILGIPTGMYNLDNILHIWKLDEGKVGYNNLDSRVEKLKLDNRYQVMFLCNDSKNVYIAGLFNNNPFIITYDASTLRITNKVVYKEIEIDEFSDLRVLDGNFLILSKNMLYITDQTSKKEMIRLENECQRIKIFNGEIILSSGQNIVKIILSKFESKTETLQYLIYNSQDTCNNIDIFVKGAGRTERIVLIDGETNKEILPSFYMVFKGNSFIKLLNSNSKKIILKLSVGPTSDVEGIILRENKMFLR